MPRRSSPSSSDGFSIVELLIGMTITLVVTGAALTLALSGRNLAETDQARVNLNQNLRSAKGMLMADIRQAGERLGADFPSLEIVDGASGAPDELTVRTNLLGTVLRLCRDVDPGDTEVYVGEPVNPPAPPPGCSAVPDGDSDGWPDNIQAWREHRLAVGSAAPAFIYDPTTGEGEFFLYTGEHATNLLLNADDGTWARSYTAATNCRVYLLEERRYRLNGSLLQMIVNDDTAAPVNLVEGFGDLQLAARFQDGSVQASLGYGDAWSDLAAIRIRLWGQVPIADGETLERFWTSEVMPRNALSH